MKEFFRRFNKVRLERMTIDELKEEYEHKINALKEELDYKIAELQKEEKESDKKWWKPEYNGNYYFITSVGGIGCNIYKNDSVDNKYYNFHNMFKTKKEAEFAIKRWKVMRELEMLADDDQPWDERNAHYAIQHNYIESVYGTKLFHARTNPFYFKSKESAENAINSIGEGRLKKYWLGMKED